MLVDRLGEDTGTGGRWEVNVTESSARCLNIFEPHTSSLLGNYNTMSNINKMTIHKTTKKVRSPDGGREFEPDMVDPLGTNEHACVCKVIGHFASCMFNEAKFSQHAQLAFRD